jgi:Domain of unknown function (DUF3885)
MERTFDPTWDSAFKGSPFWLRFELGGEDFGCVDAPVPRFVQALTRARYIRDALFADSEQVWAIAASHAEPFRDFYAPVPDAFEALSKIGFNGSTSAEWRAPLSSNEHGDEDEDFVWRAFNVTLDIRNQDALLWCSICYEMPIEPKSPVVSHLADFERGILLHVYDDRGMDVLALEAAPLLPLYERFDAWLLDYDRERMRAAFAGV